MKLHLLGKLLKELDQINSISIDKSEVLFSNLDVTKQTRPRLLIFYSGRRMIQTLRRRGDFRRENTIRETLSRIWQDFCEFSTVHGVKNVYEDFCYLNKSTTKAALPQK